MIMTTLHRKECKTIILYLFDLECIYKINSDDCDSFLYSKLLIQLRNYYINELLYIIIDVTLTAMLYLSNDWIYNIYENEKNKRSRKKQ